MQLSKHFKLEEMTKSMTAVRKGIDNSPGFVTVPPAAATICASNSFIDMISPQLIKM